MHNTINLRSLTAHLQAVADVPSDRYHTAAYAERPPAGEPNFVREEGRGFELPEADAYARRLAEEAEAWLAHTRTRARMKEETVVRKALSALAFSFGYRTHNFAVPSKLTGTSKHQPALWSMVKSHIGLGTPLQIDERDGSTSTHPRLVVSYDGDELGEVQSKHVPWLRPLLPFGAGVYLIRVTGRERDFTLGCNVAFGRVGSALTALNHALGTDVGGNGYGGDGASVEAFQARTDTASMEARPVPHHGGDGAPDSGGDGMRDHLRIVQPGARSVAPKASPEDVVLYREIDGTAKATVEHVVRHSPSGIEWGYCGSGPADLARSVLLAFSDEATVERLYQRFKAQVIAAVPKAGGVIRAADIRGWLADNER